MNLPESAAYIESRLEEMGISSRRCGVIQESFKKKYEAIGFADVDDPTGIVAIIGKGSPCILLRADFDALPMEEENDLPFCSRRHAAHMCGHDSHAAMLLGAAKILKDREKELKGTVKLMFQPGEELGSGSKTMIDDGVLENPHVDAALGMHIMTTTEKGKVTYVKDVASSSLDSFIVKIQGKGGHSSTPQLTIDPLAIANQIYGAVNLLMTREVAPGAPVTLSVGVQRGGTVLNIIPDTAEIQIGMRTYDEESRQHIMKRLPEIIDAYVHAWRGEYELITVNCPTTMTDFGVTRELLPAVEEIVGAENVVEARPMSGTEDFGYVAAAVPSSFLVLGCGGPGAVPHHNPRMTLDEGVFYEGAAVYANCAIEWLKSHANN